MGGQDQVSSEYIKDTSKSKVIQLQEDQPQFLRDAAPFIMPAVSLVGYITIWQLTGNIVLGVWLIYMATPIYNMFFLNDVHNIAPKVEKAYINSKMFVIPGLVCVLTSLASQIYCIMLFSTKWQPDLPIFLSTPDTPLQKFVLSMVCGYFAASSLAIGHEFVHWPGTFEKILGSVPYMQSFYSHFWDEHVNGHHKNIATPEDPVCSPQGMAFYTHFVRAVTGTHVKCWAREQRRLEKRYSQEPSTLTTLTENRMIYYFIMHVCILFGVYEIFGMGGLKCQLCCVFQGLFWTEMVNYIEHYGLNRKKDKDGIYETITYMHSWNALSSFVAFRLQRHSDHHAHKFRPYQILRRFERAPQLPYEYIYMLFLALFPPVFFYMMDPIVNSIEDTKKGIDNKDRWNCEMEYSEDDLRRKRNGNIFLVVVSLIFTSLLFI